VRLVCFDVDGTLTDGRLVLGERGEEYKVFHSRDGQGLVMLREAGLQVGVITGRSSPVVAERMGALGISFVFQGANAKLPVFEELLQRLKLAPDQAAFVETPPIRGDAAGLAIAVAVRIRR
jgi:3-deoxy-D-manno-octulosonate 8-phosphate phosphatase (KDO 8-P phosphatase)